MKIEKNKKYFTIGLYTVIVFTICLLLVVAVFKFNGLVAILKNIFKVLSPIIWGLVLAYLLNPIMIFIEKYLKKWLEKKKPHAKLCRYLSLTITTLLTLVVLGGLIAIVLPQLITSIYSIFSNSQTYLENAENWINKLLDNNPKIKDFVNSEFQTLQVYLTDYINKLQPQLTSFISNITTGVFNILIGIKDFILGLIVMVYLLASKEVFMGQTKKVMYAILPTKTCENMLSVWHKADKTFIGFISGKVLDSFIIGMISFIAMTLMNMPYTVLISFIIGITNMIPFFGPFIGAIPSGLLILLANPDKVVAFVVFIIILQQFDGNILGPKILGDSTGLPAFWVIFAIFIGGGLFGFIGMLVCVPVFAVIYMLVREFIEKRLEQRNLPQSTKAYKYGERIKQMISSIQNEMKKLMRKK